MMFACAMPREQFPWADEISFACACIWQGQQCQLITLGGGVIYYFQTVMINRFLIFPFLIYSEIEDWEKLGLNPINTNVFSLGLIKYLCALHRESICRVSYLKGGHPQPWSTPAPLTFKRVQMTSVLFLTSFYT